MKPHLSGCKKSFPIVFACLFAAVLLGPLAARARMIDLNTNGISDVWEWTYGMYGVNPSADPDNDKFSNLLEAIAGTNPNDSNSFPHIRAALAGTNLTISSACTPGKNYQLLACTPNGQPLTNWTPVTNILITTGTNLTFSMPVTPTATFYKISISDVDSDGDGLTDWEEYQLGLDPNNPSSSAQQDSFGNALSDYAFAAGKLALQNVVTISATDPVTTQPDPGTAVTDAGIFTVSRGGFPLGAITVGLVSSSPGPGYGTSGVDFSPLPFLVTIPAGASSTTITLTPLANTNLHAPVIASLSLQPGTGYTLGTATNASVVIYPSPTGLGTGLTGQYFTNANVTYTNSINFAASNLFLTRIDPTVDFTWYTNLTPNLSNGYYCVRWTGQVQPQYSETYTFDVLVDDGVKLWVNDQLLIDKWSSNNAVEPTNFITLQAGVLYDIKMEYLQLTKSAQAHLSWYSPSQSKQVIPNTSLYNANQTGGTNALPAITSLLTAVGFVGQTFSFSVTAANLPLGFTAKGLPPGLTFNVTNGLISGTPTVSGTYQASLTASNSFGTSASVLSIQIFNTGGVVSSVVDEIWTNVPGTNIANIPVTTVASVTNLLGTLEGVTGYGANYGERVRGYFTAPVTGNYYFWIAGSDSAQLFISNDGESVNQVMRAAVTNATAPRQWTISPNQQSPWLALTAGQQYFIQILHKAGTGTNDNWSVGYLQDPSGTNTTPAGVVPGYLLSRYYPPLPSIVSGTLYTADLLAVPGVVTGGGGSATLRVNASGTQATLNFQLNDLAGTATGEAINASPYLTNPDELIYDISAAKQQPNGSYLWNIKTTGTYTNTADILSAIAGGRTYISIESTAFPNGELAGNFVLATGTQNFVPPATPPAWTDDHANSNAASRFLIQSTFGPAPTDIASVQSLGYAGWLSNQFSLPASHTLTNVLANPYSDPTDLYQSTDWFNAWWRQSVTAPDQLRQRVAFALSEIMVISENGALQNNALALASYYDTLVDNAFGNYRTLLQAVTLHPAMGIYLNMVANAKGSIVTGLHANENYAREIQQLFSVGLNRLWPDGSLVLNSQGNLVPTYNQNVVMGFAATFTGWAYYQTNQANGRAPTSLYPAGNYTNGMVLVPSYHDLNSKLLLDNVVLPPALGLQASSTNVAYDYYGLTNLNAAMDDIFYNQNVGPFICRELIQRLVTSTPSAGYVYRVTSVFNNDGTGVRGNLQAVVQAILMDYEARSTDLLSQTAYGKQREPLLRATALARAFPSPGSITGTYSENGDQKIVVVTSTPHRMNTGDQALLQFTDGSTNSAPNSVGYSITYSNTTTFTVTAPNFIVGTYGQTNGILTAAVSGHALGVGYPLYLVFTTSTTTNGPPTNGLFTVATVIDSSHITVTNADLVTRAGACLLPKLAVGGFTPTKTNALISTTGPHGLNVNDTVYIDFTSGVLVDGQYQVASVPDPSHFTINVVSAGGSAQNSLSIWPLVAPQLNRSGTVIVNQNTWNMGYTDTSSTISLNESPLRSPTVFNFYYPSYAFPGTLATAGLTTPEFQLTSDTGVALQMNFMEAAILGNTGNTNGLSSFNNGNGSIVLDIGQYMTTNYTSTNGIPGLVDNFNSLLLAGQLSSSAKNYIVTYISNTTNYPYTLPTPTQGQMRDRVRGVINLMVSSPDYIIQK